MVSISESLDREERTKRIQQLESAFHEPRTVYALQARRLNAIFYQQLRAELTQIDGSLPAKNDGLLSPLDREDPEDGFTLPERIAEGLFPATVQIYAARREAILQAEFMAPRVISPRSGENQHLVNQRGLFTKLSKPISIERWVTEFYGQTSRRSNRRRADPAQNKSTERAMVGGAEVVGCLEHKLPVALSGSSGRCAIFQRQDRKSHMIGAIRSTLGSLRDPCIALLDNSSNLFDQFLPKTETRAHDL